MGRRAVVTDIGDVLGVEHAKHFGWLEAEGPGFPDVPLLQLIDERVRVPPVVLGRRRENPDRGA